MIIVCPECSTPFNRRPCLIAKSRINYCSVKCKSKHNNLTEEEKRARALKRSRDWEKDNKGYRKEYYNKNREHLLPKILKYAKDHREEARLRASLYRKNNKEKIKNDSRIWREKNRDRIKKQNSDALKLSIGNLDDRYIKKQLHSLTGLKSNEIPQSLVEAKREHIKLHRLIQERQ